MAQNWQRIKKFSQAWRLGSACDHDGLWSGDENALQRGPACRHHALAHVPSAQTSARPPLRLV